MAEAPPDTFLAVAWSGMRLHDAQLLKIAQSHFKSVKLNKCYHLRLPSERSCLAVPEATVTNGKVVKRTIKGVSIVASSVAGPIGIGLVGGTFAARHYWKKFKAENRARKSIARAGEPGTNISFITVLGSEGKYSEKSPKNEKPLCYGMLVNIIEHAGSGRNGLGASSDNASLTQVRVVHCEERHREQSRGRAVCIRDRILLKEEVYRKLLSRKKIEENRWELGFGISDDNLWVVSSPM